MKRKELKNIMKQAIQQFFEQSGLEKIFLGTYNNTKNIGKQSSKPAQQKLPKTKNYLQMLDDEGDEVENAPKQRRPRPKSTRPGGIKGRPNVPNPRTTKPQPNSLQKKLQNEGALRSLRQRYSTLAAEEDSYNEEDYMDEEDIKTGIVQASPKNLRLFTSQNIQAPDSILSLGTDNLPQFLRKGIENMKNEDKS